MSRGHSAPRSMSPAPGAGVVVIPMPAGARKKGAPLAGTFAGIAAERSALWVLTRVGGDRGRPTALGSNELQLLAAHRGPVRWT